MKKGYKKLNRLDCTISIRVSKQEKQMLDELQEGCFNVSRYFRKVLKEVYENSKEKRRQVDAV